MYSKKWFIEKSESVILHFHVEIQQNKVKQDSSYRNTPSIRRKPEWQQIHTNHVQLQCCVLTKDSNPAGKFKRFSAYEKIGNMW